MKQLLLQERYSVFTLEVEKQETLFTSVDGIIDHLKRQIDANEIATFIAIFDHYAHTHSLKDGQIDDGILDAKNVVFCFGITLPNPQAMAMRPRSIGVVETRSEFVITFMEAPMPLANVAMESWAKSIKNRQAA
jgi:hypothetical protein